VLAATFWAESAQQKCYPTDRHLLIVNKLLFLSLSLSLSLGEELRVQIDHGAAREEEGAPKDQHLGPSALFPAHPATPTKSVPQFSIALRLSFFSFVLQSLSLARARALKRARGQPSDFAASSGRGPRRSRPETNLVRTCGGGTVPGHEAEVPVLPTQGQRTGSEEARGERAPLDADTNSQKSVP